MNYPNTRFSLKRYKEALDETSDRPLREVVNYDRVFGAYRERVVRTNADNTATRPDGVDRLEFEEKMRFQGWAHHVANRIRNWRDIDLGHNREVRWDKGDGRERVIEVMALENQLIAAALLDHVLGRIPLPDEFCSVPGKGVLEAFRRLVGVLTFLKLDVRDFYPSIQHEAIRAVLRGRWPQDDIELALTICALPVRQRNGRMVTRTGVGISQGNPLSAYLAMLVISDLPELLGNLVTVQVYYVDDFVLAVGPEQAEFVKKVVEEYLETKGLRLKETTFEEVYFDVDKEVTVLGQPLRALQEQHRDQGPEGFEESLRYLWVQDEPDLVKG